MVGSYTEGDEPVPGFRLVSVLGWGRFGEVWKATGPGGILVALKIIPISNDQGQKEFRAMQMVKQIRHPNLVPIMAFWLKDRQGNLIDDSLVNSNAEFLECSAAEMVIAMGLGEQSLADRLRDCRAIGVAGIPASELLRYMGDVARGIDYLNQPIHDFGDGRLAVTHCDIKPHNILLVGGVAQIADLGVVQVLGRADASGATGSAAYMAPEFIRDGKPSQTTDLYSLAISYYELRTGFLPFEVKSATAAYLAHLEGRLSFDRLPEAERAVIVRATCVNPDRRQENCGMLVQELREAFNTSGAEEMIPGECVLVNESIEDEESLLTEQAEVYHTACATASQGRRTDRAPFQGLIPEGVYPECTPVGPAPIPQRREPPRACPTTPAIPQKRRKRAVLLASQAAALVLGVTLAGLTSSSYRAASKAHQTAPPIPAERSEELQPPLRQVVSSATGPTDRAMQQLVAGNYDGAVYEFSRSIERNPNSAAAYFGRATAYSEMGQYQQAVADFGLAIRLNPRDAAAYQGRGLAYLRQGNTIQAVGDCSHALQLDRRLAEAHYTRSQAYQLRKEYGSSIADYSAAIRLREGTRAATTVTGLAFSPNGQWLAVARHDAARLPSIQVWSRNKDRSALSIPGHTCLAFSPDSRVLAAAGPENTLIVWSFDLGRVIQRFKGHTGPVTSVCFSKDGKRLASGGNDGYVRVWDLDLASLVASFTGRSKSITSVRFTPDDQNLVFAGTDETIEMWNIVSGEQVRKFTGHDGRVNALTVSPDGSLIASASVDMTVKIWDLRLGTEIKTLSGHTADVTCLAFSPDSRILVSSSADPSWLDRPGQVKIWDVDAGRARRTLGGHAQGIMSLAFSPDGKQLASGSAHWHVLLWELAALEGPANQPWQDPRILENSVVSIRR